MSASGPAALQAPLRQLLVFEFPPGSTFEGHLVGALERVESGGSLRIRDAIFVARDPAADELVAVSMSADGASGMVSRLISFRLDPRARAQSTERALSGPAGGFIRSLAEQLELGAAVMAVLIEHAWTEVLRDALGRAGGTAVRSDFVADARISEAWKADAPGPGP